ncbi:MAG: cbb3-type cytochrome c oxidase subunit I [Deltaproteobacteria bacterium]|nr:cbb3-type cytochrome c oxidase subunit I [Kofleriaceae bacterium]
MTAHVDFWRDGRSVSSWLLTKDHKRIGVMFFVGVTLSLLVGGIFALLLRLELLTPERTIMDAETYNQMFTHHGVVMVWLFMIPSIPAVFGNFFLPIMIGARDVAFPRLNLASFWIYVLGSAVTLWALLAGGVDTGWTFYAPYSTTTTGEVGLVVLGIFILGISTIITGINFIVTVHTLRADGVTWHRMPLFVWAIYATSIIQVLATPVLGLSIALVGIDHLWGLQLFDPAAGGDPVLFQHLFWFYSHPAVYIMILPTLGVISEVVCTHAHNPPVSYRALAYSSLGIAVIGFLTWGHHMFVSGMSAFDAGLFGILSMFVAIFSAVKVFTWTATLYRGRIALNTPMLYFFGFAFLFVFGGMSGVAVATASLDVHWHDTYFVVAHFHFIMVGGTLIGFLAALHYWFPKITGRTYSERWGLVSSMMVTLGFFFTFMPQFLLGNAGMPRRYYSYPEHFQWLNVLSTAGASVLALGLLFTVGYLVAAAVRGRRVGDNPWGSRSFEWRVPSPPPTHNFVGEPRWTRGPYEYHHDEPERDHVRRG